MNRDFLDTSRLRLRTWTDRDLPAFAALNGDARVMEFMPQVLAVDESNALAGRIRDHFVRHGFGLWAVEIAGHAEFIGFVGLSVPKFEAHFTPCVEIGWRLAYEHWGKGYATEGATAVVAYAFSDLNLDQLVSFTAPANHRSQRVMKRIGMTHCSDDDFEHPALPESHPLRRHVLYKLSRDKWKGVQPP